MFVRPSTVMLLAFVVMNSIFSAPDWSRNAEVPLGQDRSDIYGYGELLPEVKREGYIHALKWPVEVTGLLIPHEPLKFFLEEKKTSKLYQRMTGEKRYYPLP